MNSSNSKKGVKKEYPKISKKGGVTTNISGRFEEILYLKKYELKAVVVKFTRCGNFL